MTFARAVSDSAQPPASAMFHANGNRPLSMFNAGSEIYVPGQKATTLYRIEFGAVRVYRLLSDGRRQVIAFYLAGEMFGLEVGETHSSFAEAMVSTGVKTYSPSENSGHQADLLRIALHGMMRAQEHILVIGRQTAVERLAAFLLDIAKRQGELKQFDLPMSRLDIADYLGLTIETVSRVLAKLRSSGLIRLPSIRSVEISDMNALHGFCA